MPRKFSLVLIFISSFAFAEEKCFPVHEVDLVGATVLHNIPINYDNCFNNDLLNKIQNNIRSEYINKGYPAPQMKVIPQDIRSGVLKIDIVEKRLRKLEYKSSDHGFNKELFWAFPKQDLLSINDLNQGTKNLNRLPSNKAKMEIVEGETGKFDVLVHNEKSKPWKILLATDNTSSNRQGNVIGTATLAYDNFLGLNDSWILSTSINPKDSKENQDNSKYFMYKQPYGYNAFSIYYKRSEQKYLTKLQVNFHPIFIDSQVYGFKYDRDFAKVGNRSSKISNKLEKKTNFIALRDIPLTNYNKNYVSLTSMYENVWQLDNKAIAAKLGFKKGLGMLGGEYQHKIGANPEFLMLKFASEISNKVKISDKYSLIHKAELDSQYSFSNLSDSEKLQSGGYQTIRGYPVNIISGASGFNVTQDYLLAVGEMPIVPFVAIDMAYSRRNRIDNIIIGVGAGIRGEYRFFNYELLYAAPLANNIDFTSDGEIYFNLGAKF